MRRARSVSPGRTGFSHFSSSIPGAPIELELVDEAVGDEPHQESAALPAGRDQPAGEAPLRGVLVGVEGLGVELAREGDDLVLRHRDRAGDIGGAGAEVFEVETGHARGTKLRAPYHARRSESQSVSGMAALRSAAPRRRRRVQIEIGAVAAVIAPAREIEDEGQADDEPEQQLRLTVTRQQKRIGNRLRE